MFFPVFLILYPLCLSSVVARPEKADQEFVKLQHSLRCKKGSTETATYLYSGAMTLGFFSLYFKHRRVPVTFRSIAGLAGWYTGQCHSVGTGSCKIGG
uniref:Putative secreted protein n=1 Tax=Ixodes scapularis TaxID=6945 RepID=A0A4D5RD37_IXOSC